MGKSLREIIDWNSTRSERDHARMSDKQTARKEIRENLPDNLTRAPRVL